MHVYLETERLILRRFTSDDVDLITALDADPAVMNYINGGRPTPREEVLDDILPWWLAYYDRGDQYGFWAAIEKSSGTFLGWFHLRPQPDDPPDEPELGYRFMADAWGKGYATEGSRALINRAFEKFGARRVHASTMVVNVGSWRVMEKSGLRRVRIFHQPWPDRIEGEEHGDVEYALTREEWELECSGVTDGGGDRVVGSHETGPTTGIDFGRPGWTLLASSGLTGGAFELFQEVRPTLGGPPPHVHRERDEAFYVIEGRYRFVRDAEEVELFPGSFIFVPRGTRHAYRTLEPDCRTLILVAPAGLEDFFREMGQRMAAGATAPEAMAALSSTHDSHPVD